MVLDMAQDRSAPELFELADEQSPRRPASPKVVLGWGLGVESTAILVRWLLEPSSRDFELDDLVVLTALTGDEFSVTHQLVEAHVLGLLRQQQVRLVQVCRAGQKESDGIVVVDDSRQPSRSHRHGPWRLSDELRSAGTVPQYAAGRRLCSIRAKGSVLDRWLAEHIEGSFRHVIGFNVEETSRVLRDRSYSSAARQSEYPLVDWGWSRQDCEAYLEGVFSVPWHKSCCGFCPFRGGSLDEVFDDWDLDQPAALDALLLERRAMALNDKMTLYAGSSALDAAIARRPQTAWAFAELLERSEHSLVDLRRIVPASKADPGKKAPGWRSVRVQRSGSLEDCEQHLAALAEERGLVVEVDEHGIARAYELRRSGSLPDLEWFYVVCPAGVLDKERSGFEARWEALASPAATLFSKVAS